MPSAPILPSSGSSRRLDAYHLNRQQPRAVGRHHGGGKDRLGNISKRGDRYLRSLFTTGALAPRQQRGEPGPMLGTVDFGVADHRAGCPV